MPGYLVKAKVIRMKSDRRIMKTGEYHSTWFFSGFKPTYKEPIFLLMV
jgi:hypothetical protein